MTKLLFVVPLIVLAGCSTNPQQQALLMQSMSDMTASCAKAAMSASTDLGKVTIMNSCNKTVAATVRQPESKTGKYVLQGLSVLAKAWVGVKGVEALSDFGIAAVENAGGNTTNTIGNDGFIGDGGIGFTVDQTAPPAFAPVAEEPAL